MLPCLLSSLAFHWASQIYATNFGGTDPSTSVPLGQLLHDMEKGELILLTMSCVAAIPGSELDKGQTIAGLLFQHRLGSDCPSNNNLLVSTKFVSHPISMAQGRVQCLVIDVEVPVALEQAFTVRSLCMGAD